MANKVIYAVYEDPELLKDGARKLVSHGVKVKDTWSPFPIHGIDPIIGVKRTRLAIELRREATRRDIDRIRVPHLEGIEPEMLTAFGRLARRELEREVSLVVRSELTLGRAAPVPFLWSHF